MYWTEPSYTGAWWGEWEVVLRVYGVKEVYSRTCMYAYRAGVYGCTEVCHYLSFSVSSQFEFMSFVAI